MSDENSIEEILIEDLKEIIDNETKGEFVTSIISHSDNDKGDEDAEKVVVVPSVPDPTLVLKPAMTVGIPEKSAVVEDDDDDDEDFEDETLGERLYALTEMFPKGVRNLTWSIGSGSLSLTKGIYSFSRSALWVFTTSAIFLAAAPVIQNELDQIEEMNRAQQRQILLGPGALSGPNSPAMHHS